MPVKTCLSNILSVRFDFGVPLEDVFPPYDIHPRLKYLFSKAFDAYDIHETDVDFILRHGQATLSERLKLKDKLVLSLDYHLNTEEYSPGTFFWLIRHFLGLLPLPVLPSYTKDVQFHWNHLADECKSMFKYGAHNSERENLDYNIAQSLNMLPIENVILLNVLITFLRNICMRKAMGRHKFNRSSLMALCNYYCSSLFVRPFRPGHFQKNEYKPLLIYLILRWHHISEHCRSIGHPTYFLESDLSNVKNHQNIGLKNSNTQTSLFPNAFFDPEIITICKKIPYFVEFCKKYLKDIACQTETDFSKEGEVVSDVNLIKDGIKSFKKEVDNENTYAYKLTCIEELEEDHGSTRDEVLENDITLYQTARDFTFRSSLDDEEKLDWPNILKETSETVKKVEEQYIYDDYETFKREDFNQIGKSKTGKYLWSKQNTSDLAEKLPGPKSYPILGNALTFWCKDEDIFENLTRCISQYPSPMRFWNGLKLCIVFSDATQVEKIFSSTALATKDDVYKFIQYFNGMGLISGSGPKWKKDRRLMSPLFLKRNIMQYFPVILKHTKILIKILQKKIDGRTFNIEHDIRRASTDFVNETIIGMKSNAQGGEMDDFLTSISRAYELVHRRIIKPWLQIDWFYRLTPNYREQVAAKKVIHGFFWQVLDKAKESHSHLGQKNSVRTVLEHMLDIRDEVPDFATDEEIIHHLATLYSASEDTVTVICAFTLVLLGMYPKYQKQVASEISTVVGFKNDVQEEHLPKLEVLEMVIKETLRLFPIAPFIMRQTTQDTELEGYRIPQGTSVIVSIHNIHRDPNQYEKPNDFYPEHFLPQAIKARHPYAYVPFSAGVRGCIGKPYSYMAMKIVLVSILQKYAVEADGTLQDKPLTTDISVRFKDKNYPVRIRCRK